MRAVGAYLGAPVMILGIEARLAIVAGRRQRRSPGAGAHAQRAAVCARAPTGAVGCGEDDVERTDNPTEGHSCEFALYCRCCATDAHGMESLVADATIPTAVAEGLHETAYIIGCCRAA